MYKYLIDKILIKKKFNVFKYLFENAIDMMMIISSHNLKIIDVNTSICNNLGYTKKEITEMDLFAFDINYHSKDKLNFVLKRLNDNSMVQLNSVFKRKDGSVFPVDLNMNCFKIKNKKYITCIIRNLTEQKKYEKLLEKEKNKALEISMFKSRFLARMSHEIRTPLNSIIGMSDLLTEYNYDDDRKRYLNILYRASNNLLQLVNDILDFSKIEAGEITFFNTQFDLEEFLIEITDLLAVQSRKKNIEIIIKNICNLQNQIITDPNRLRQVIVNIMGNAIKFTEKGFVFLSADIKKDFLKITVEDTGIGIPKDKICFVFESFKQAGLNISNKFGGTGLGLAITKKIVELMNGKIKIESEIDKGSIFEFQIPIKFGSKIDFDWKIYTDNFKNKNAILIDQDMVELSYLSSILKVFNIKFETFNDPKKSLKRCYEKDFDIYIISCKMSDTDGIELANLINMTKPVFGKTLIMLPAGGHRKSDLIKMKSLGIENKIIKPIKKRSLVKSISNILNKNKKENQKKTNKYICLDGTKNIKILLVDDAKDSHILIKAYLRKYGYQIESAENGKIALEKFKTQKFDLIFMDMQMPVIDGHEATKKIRDFEKQNKLNKTTIIAFTANALPEDNKKMIKAGCDDYITKPIYQKDLINIINKFI